MAIEFLSRILSIYKADTTQHRMAIRELSGDQKKAAQEELKRIEGSNAGVDSQIKKLGKLAIVVGSIGVAAKIAFDSLEFAGKRADLAATANIESMEGLRKSTRGLMTETELLTAAAGIQQGVYKLSQKEMENVTGAMTALAERGNDAAAVTEAFTAALVTGKTKGLKAFGIEVYEGGNRLETHNAILAKAAELSKEFAKSSLDGADKMTQSKVKFSDATDSLRESIGKTAESLTPMVSGLADIVRLLAETGAAGPVAIGALGAAITGNPAIGALLAFGAAGGFEDVTQVMFDPKGYAAKMRGATAEGTMQGAAALSASQQLQRKTMELVPGLDMDESSVGVISLRDMAKDAARFKALLKERRSLSNAYAKRITDEFLEAHGDSYIKGWAGPGQQSGAAEAGLDLTTAKQSGSMGGMEEFLRGSKEEIAEREFNREATKSEVAELARMRLESKDLPSLLDGMFGTDGEIDAKRQAWDMLTGAAVAGYDAMVDGTGKVGDAIKRSIADALKAEGSKMLVLSLGETAAGFAAIASGYGFGAAAPHFKSAAIYAAGAAAAGLAANAIGTSGGVAASDARAAAAEKNKPKAPNSSSLGAGQGSTDRIIVYDDAFAENNAHERRLRAEKLVRRVTGSGSVRNN